MPTKKAKVKSKPESKAKSTIKSKVKAVASKLLSRKTKGTGDNQVPAREEDVLSRKNVDGTVAVMKLADDEYFFTIDGIAAEVWMLIDGKATLGDIKAKLIKKHNPPEARFNKDVQNMMKDLKKAGLIRLG